MNVREDFRRDGLAANFLADEKLIELAAHSLPESLINIGYPAICEKEYEMCSRILHNTKQGSAELCVVGHCREEHIENMARLIEPYDNTSANSWIPVSDHFLKKIGKDEKEALDMLENNLETWGKNSKKPFDLAFVDCTAEESGLFERIYEWAELAFSHDVRNIIICDTQGIGTKKKIDKIFGRLEDFEGKIEFHPHNDNGNAIRNIERVMGYGVETIGTSFYHAGERKSMIDPRELRKFPLNFNEDIFTEFDNLYRTEIGDPELLISEVYDPNVIVTGSQHRLRARNEKLEMKFGVTTDTYIASKMLQREIGSLELRMLKNHLLYENKNIILDKETLTQEYKKNQR